MWSESMQTVVNTWHSSTTVLAPPSWNTGSAHQLPLGRLSYFSFIQQHHMENYCKGKNVEEPLQKDNIPIPNLPDNFLWMTVSAGSKIQHLLRSALAEFPKHRAVVWSGSGPAVGKVVSCAEIMKKKHGGSLYQLNKICYRTVEEYWDPLVENIDQLVVKRRLPVIHILLSMDALDASELGYQPPGTTIARELQALNMNRQS
ncbi:Ribonuclease P/MRP subunit p25 [Carabus blaptoides fortunei]